ncbi:hypothetical protein VUR80DRAFT_875 [Thermomyces stellatus]
MGSSFPLAASASSRKPGPGDGSKRGRTSRLLWHLGLVALLCFCNFHIWTPSRSTPDFRHVPRTSPPTRPQTLDFRVNVQYRSASPFLIIAYRALDHCPAAIHPPLHSLSARLTSCRRISGHYPRIVFPSFFSRREECDVFFASCQSIKLPLASHTLLPGSFALGIIPRHPWNLAN